MEVLFKDVKDGHLFLHNDRVFTKVTIVDKGTNAYDQKANKHVAIGSHTYVEELCTHAMCRKQGKRHFHRVNIWEADDANVFKTYMV